MSGKIKGWKKGILFACLMAWICGLTVFADGLSGDNSLSSLGLMVDGATVTPEFSYSTIEYQVTVPAGTTEVALDPVTSNPSASITSITGEELVNGEGTVIITVQAENGMECSYYLYVTSAEDAASTAPSEVSTEKETEPPTEKETESETEDPRYVRVERNSLEEAEKTIDTLKTETASYRDRLKLLMRILYGMIAFCVVLLFIVINLTLKKRDLKAELKGYKQQGYPPEEGQYGDQGQYGDGGDAYQQPYEDQQANAPYGYGGDYYQEGYEDQQAAGYEEQQIPGYEEQQIPGYEEQQAAGYEEQQISDYEGQQTPGYEEQQAPDHEEQQAPGYESQQATNYGEQQAPGYGKGWESSGGEQYGSDGRPAGNGPVNTADDPAKSPKSSRAKKKAKKMPEYKEPQSNPKRQPSKRGSQKKDVEITMIDL